MVDGTELQNRAMNAVYTPIFAPRSIAQANEGRRGGYDAGSLSAVLRDHGFREIVRRSFQTGIFPDGCIDREQHKPYSLYVETMK